MFQALLEQVTYLSRLTFLWPVCELTVQTAAAPVKNSVTIDASRGISLNYKRADFYFPYVRVRLIFSYWQPFLYTLTDTLLYFSSDG